jgi:arylamine N-acetyltransferase
VKLSQSTNDVSTYSTNYTIKNISGIELPDGSVRPGSGKTIVVKYRKRDYFCDAPYGDMANPNALFCGANGHETEETVTLDPGQSQTVTISRSSPYTSACGAIQLDFDIVEIDGNTSCNWNDHYLPDQYLAAWG